MSFTVTEQFTASKIGVDDTNEDVVIDTDDWLVVCDGATDKSGKTFDGRTGGQIAAQLTARTVVESPNGASPQAILDSINTAYHQRFGPHLDALGNGRPSCTMLAVDKRAGTILRVGDITWSDGTTVHEVTMQIDVVHSQMRSAYLAMLMLEGATQAELLARDPSRAIIFPGLQLQGALRNNPDAGHLAYAAIDGTPIPEQFIETWEIPNTAEQIIVATDGYPAVLPTLELTEAYLFDDLAQDPLRIGQHASTKAMPAGQISFDDRTYVRLQRRITSQPEHS